MNTSRFFLLMLLALAAAGCAKGRPAAEITTRQGGHFLVVDPHANYLRVCYESQFDVMKLTAWTGLRIDESEAKPAVGQDQVEIPWADIDRVDFGAPSGELGDFCPGLPQYLAATVRFKDGHTEQHKLEDTTDDGVDGSAERGNVVIPLRNIASLTMVKDEKWPWSTAEEQDYEVTIKATWTDGKVTVVTDPTYTLNASKQRDNDSLISPVTDAAKGFPALIGGARVDLPWYVLKSIDVESAPGEPVKDKLTFTDGHTEEVGMATANMDSLTRDDNPESPVHVKHMDVEAKLAARPKPN